jgi:hypothetical protein
MNRFSSDPFSLPKVDCLNLYSQTKKKKNLLELWRNRFFIFFQADCLNSGRIGSLFSFVIFLESRLFKLLRIGSLFSEKDYLNFLEN